MATDHVLPGFTTGTEMLAPTYLFNLGPDGDGLVVSEFAGIGSRHSVYLRHEDNAYLYLSAPEGGEFHSLQRWAKTVREVRVWEIDAPANPERPFDDPFYANTVAAWRDATEYAMKQAFDEVEREHS